MSILGWFRNLFVGSPEAAEADAAESEDFGTSDAGAEDLKHIEAGEDAGSRSGIRTPEAAEVALEDLSEEEAPPDPAP